MFDWLTALGRSSPRGPRAEVLARALFEGLTPARPREWPGLGVVRIRVHDAVPDQHPGCRLPVFLPAEPIRQALNPELPHRPDRHGDTAWLDRLGWDASQARRRATRILRSLLQGRGPDVPGLGRLFLVERPAFRGPDGTEIPAGHAVEVAFAPEAVLAANPDPSAASFAMLLTVSAATRRGLGRELYRDWAHLARMPPAPRSSPPPGRP